MVFVQCGDITEGGTNEFSLFLPVEDSIEYSIEAKANVSKLKTWGSRLIDSVICHCACGPDKDGYGDDGEEDDDDEAQVQCYIPDALHLFYMRCSKPRFPLHHSRNRSTLHQFAVCPPPLLWQHSGDSARSAPLNAPLRIAFESPQLHRGWLGCLATGQHRDDWRKPPPLCKTQTSVIPELLCARLSKFQLGGLCFRERKKRATQN